MKSIKTFEAFIQEADEEAPKGGEKTAAEPETPTIDKDKERLKDFEINGKTYKGVLSTFEAIASKQKAMGQAEVGVISIPGDDAAYELFLEEGDKEGPSGEEPKKKKEEDSGQTL
jgi:hypothetical protein